MSNDPEERKVCFASLQKQRWTPNSTISLCDAMDLLVVGTNLRRTMNWQQNNLGSLNGDVIAWHEKMIVSAKGLTVSVYSLEGILAAENEAEQEEMANLVTTNLTELGPVVANDSIKQMRFCVAAKPHRKWIEQEENQNIKIGIETAELSVSTPSLQVDYSYLLDGSTADDTPYAKSVESETFQHEEPEESKLAEMPTNHSRLSMLAVTTSKRLYLFAYGCYPLVLHLPLLPSNDHTVALSHDLSHTIVTADHRLLIYTIPSVSTHRKDMQVLASQYPRIFAIFRSMQANLPEIASAWKISLKPINVKMQALIKVLVDYGCLSDEPENEAALRHLLVRYIVLGPQCPELGNAIDQFFTGNQMNDQLVIRMERSLQSALANIQETVRTKIVEPARRLIEECQTIWGLTTTSELFAPCQLLANYLLESSFQVWTAAQQCQAKLSQDRKRLTEDWVPWLRSIAAQIKANGTAVQSVQRQNAAKRRVGDQVLKRVISYLKEGNGDTTCINDERTATEHMLNLNFVSSVQSGTTSSLPAILSDAQDWADKLFLQPRALIVSQSTVLTLQTPTLMSKLAQTAVVTRMDGDGQLFQGRLSSLGIRQWCVMAIPLSQSDCLVLNAIPLTSMSATGQRDKSESAILGDRVLSCRLQFPHPISDISFYNDDGRSAFSDAKVAYGEEGQRQKLGVLLQPKSNVSSQESTGELWLLKYDDLPFELITLRSERTDNFKTSLIMPEESYRSFPVPVVPLTLNDEAEDVSFNGTCVTASTRSVTMKRREVCTSEGEPPVIPRSRLLLSGPRGVGVVHSATSNSGSTMEIFDLEDTEDDDSDEERDTSMEVE